MAEPDTTSEPEAKKSKMDSSDEEMTVQFENEDGARPFPSFSIPVSLGQDKLIVLLRALLKQKREEDGDDDDEEAAEEADSTPYLFYVGEEEVRTDIRECLKRLVVNRERTLPIVYKPQAIFR